MPKSTNLSFLGIAKETAAGTAAVPTAFIPVSPPTPKDNLTLLDDAGLRGSMVSLYGEVAGPLNSEVDFDGDVFPDTVGWMLAGILGDVAETGTDGPFTHTMAVKNNGDGQPPSYSLTDYYVAGTRTYAGMKFSELDLKFSSDAMFTYSAKAMGYGSVTADTPTPSFTALPPLASWVGAISIGGTQLTVITDGEVDIKRSVTPINAVNGSQQPASVWGGPVTVDGKLTAIMDADTELLRYLNNEHPALLIDYSTGTGTDAVQIQLQMSNVAYSAAEIGRGSDYVTLDITWSAIANTTDAGASGGYSPIQVTLKNGIQSGVYL